MIAQAGSKFSITACFSFLVRCSSLEVGRKGGGESGIQYQKSGLTNLQSNLVKINRLLRGILISIGTAVTNIATYGTTPFDFPEWPHLISDGVPKSLYLTPFASPDEEVNAPPIYLPVNLLTSWEYMLPKSTVTTKHEERKKTKQTAPPALNDECRSNDKIRLFPSV